MILRTWVHLRSNLTVDLAGIVLAGRMISRGIQVVISGRIGFHDFISSRSIRDRISQGQTYDKSPFR